MKERGGRTVRSAGWCRHWIGDSCDLVICASHVFAKPHVGRKVGQIADATSRIGNGVPRLNLPLATWAFLPFLSPHLENPTSASSALLLFRTLDSIPIAIGLWYTTPLS